MKRRQSCGFKQNAWNCVIPAWSAGIQVDMDVSGGILANLDAGNPSGMTKFHFSCSVGERKILNHFVAR
jgi:hypothetical protein